MYYRIMEACKEKPRWRQGACTLIKAALFALLPAAFSVVAGCARYKAVMHHNRGVYYYFSEVHDCRKATDEFNAALKFDSNYYLTYYYLGACRLENGEVAKALELLNSANALEKKNSEVLSTLALAHYLNDEPALAERLLGEALAIDPDDETTRRIAPGLGDLLETDR